MLFEIVTIIQHGQNTFLSGTETVKIILFSFPSFLFEIPWPDTLCQVYLKFREVAMGYLCLTVILDCGVETRKELF